MPGMFHVMPIEIREWWIGWFTGKDDTAPRPSCPLWQHEISMETRSCVGCGRTELELLR